MWKFKIFKADFGNSSHTILLKIKFARVVGVESPGQFWKPQPKGKKDQPQKWYSKAKNIQFWHNRDTIEWTSQIYDCGGGQMKQRYK